MTDKTDSKEREALRCALIAAAQAVVDRWDTPLWKDVPATAEYIGRLRAALVEAQQPAPSAAAAVGDEQKALKALHYYMTECSGHEPSISVFHRMVEEALAPQPAPTPQADSAKEAPNAMQSLTAALKNDPEYAWAWHCNLAIPIMDNAKVSHRVANITAARLMQHLFGIDTEKHPHFEVADEAPKAGSQPAPTDWYEGITEKHFDLAIHKAVQRDRAARAPADSVTAPAEESRCANCGKSAADSHERIADYPEEGEWFCSAQCKDQHDELDCPHLTHNGYRHPEESERLIACERALRSLASWLSVGGFNAPTVDAKVFEEKIRWGIEHLLQATPPTQAQAGAVPLTDEMQRQMKERCDSYEMRGAFADGWLSAEAAHGIKGGQHG